MFKAILYEIAKNKQTNQKKHPETAHMSVQNREVNRAMGIRDVLGFRGEGNSCTIL